MMKTKTLIAVIVVLILVSGLIVWNQREQRTVISERGIIKYLPFEGGFYGIVTRKGEEYLPINLPEEFKKDGLRVEFQAKLREDVATIQMWGKPIEILEIKELAMSKK